MITVRRPYTYRNCVNGIATDGNIDRQNAIAMQLDMGRASLSQSASSVDGFVIPGGSTPTTDKWCEDVYYTDANKGGIGIDPPVSKFDTKTLVGDNRVTNIPADFGGIAISAQQPNYVYYFSGTNLMRLDLSNASKTKVGTYTDPFGYPPYNTPMAFDPEGRLWIANAGQLSYWDFKGTEIQNGGEPTRGANYNVASMTTGQTDPNDLAFLHDGSVVFLTGSGANGGKTAVYYFPRAMASNSAETLSASNGTLWGRYDGIGKIAASAFGADDKLYASSGNTVLYVLNKGGVQEVVKPDPGATLGYLDLASCGFGGDKPETGGMRIQKAPVDPVTGAVLEPGTASKNKVTIAADGTAKVSYATS